MKRVRSAAVAAVMVSAVMFGSTACNLPEPCAGLSISQQDVDAAANGYEVEKEDSTGNECQLSNDGKSWSVDD